MPTARSSSLLVFALGALLSGASAGQLRPTARIVVIAPEPADARLELVSEAIVFWNETFRELGLDPVLSRAEVVVDWPETRALENYAWQVSRGAGRHLSGGAHPPAAPELDELEGEVVILLSRQGLMPFAWPVGTSGRYFVAIPPLDDSAQPPNDTRNVIAHELGHTLGLSHHEDPTSLMCMPCQPGALDTTTETAYLELAPRDRSRLSELYPKPGD